MTAVYLVSCARKKRTSAMPARDLYISNWFVKARAYIERARSPWFILSAEHGLVPPDRIISPYERSLNTMRVSERLAWSEGVMLQLEQCLPDSQRIIVFAGLKYRELLMDYLRQRTAAVEVPMSGLGIGQQLHWLIDAL